MRSTSRGDSESPAARWEAASTRSRESFRTPARRATIAGAFNDRGSQGRNRRSHEREFVDAERETVHELAFVATREFCVRHPRLRIHLHPRAARRYTLHSSTPKGGAT